MRLVAVKRTLSVQTAFLPSAYPQSPDLPFHKAPQRLLPAGRRRKQPVVFVHQFMSARLNRETVAFNMFLAFRKMRIGKCGNQPVRPIKLPVDTVSSVSARYSEPCQYWQKRHESIERIASESQPLDRPVFFRHIRTQLDERNRCG